MRDKLVYMVQTARCFTRQLLKFQLPSTYHIDTGETFYIRPYLELLRLIYDLEELSKDEIAAFVIQLTHIEKYDMVKEKILHFRNQKRGIDRQRTNYYRFFDEVFKQQLRGTYLEPIRTGDMNLRETGNKWFGNPIS